MFNIVSAPYGKSAFLYLSIIVISRTVTFVLACHHQLMDKESADTPYLCQAWYSL